MCMYLCLEIGWCNMVNSNQINATVYFKVDQRQSADAPDFKGYVYGGLTLSIFLVLSL